MNYSMLL
jgi:hypothetical protein